jgi:hypothetical protein
MEKVLQQQKFYPDLPKPLQRRGCKSRSKDITLIFKLIYQFKQVHIKEFKVICKKLINQVLFPSFGGVRGGRAL